jgi:arylsulfatase
VKELSKRLPVISGALLVASASGLTQQVTGTPGSPSATTTIDGRYIPAPPQPFNGEIELNALQSKTAWPARIVPLKGAPNILLIMTDDVGLRCAEHGWRCHSDADTPTRC